MISRVGELSSRTPGRGYLIVMMWTKEVIKSVRRIALANCPRHRLHNFSFVGMYAGRQAKHQEVMSLRLWFYSKWVCDSQLQDHFEEPQFHLGFQEDEVRS